MFVKTGENHAGRRPGAEFVAIVESFRGKLRRWGALALVLLFLAGNTGVFAMGRSSSDAKKQAEKQAKAEAREKKDSDAKSAEARGDAKQTSRPAPPGTTASGARPTSPTLSGAPTTATLSAGSAMPTTATLSAKPTTSTLTAEGATTGTTAEAPKKDKMDELIQLNLKNANIEQVISFISEKTGKSIIKPKDVNTQITVTAPEKIATIHALDLIYDALLLEGFVVLESEDRIQIVKFDSLKEGDIMTFSGPVPPEIRRQKSRLIRRVIPMKYVEADTIVPNIQPFLGKSASILTDKFTNKIIITDTVGNIERYEQILEELDVTGFEEIEVRTVELKNADVAEVCDLVSKYAKESLAAAPSRRDGGKSTRETKISAIPMPRTNSVLLVASRDVIPSVLSLIEELDKKTDVITITGSIPDELREDKNRIIRRVFLLEYSDPAGVREALRPVMGDGAVILADSNSGKLIVTGRVRDIERCEQILKEIDLPTFGNIEAKIIQLEHAEAGEVASVVNNVIREKISAASSRRDGGRSSSTNFAKSGDTAAVFAIPRTNSVLITAAKEYLDFLERMVKELDTEKPKERNVHIIELQYADPDNLGRSIGQLFPAYRRTGGSLSEKERVEVIPSGRKNAIVVIASDENFEAVKELVEKLDTEEAQKRESRRFILRYLDAGDTAKELKDLYSQMKDQRNPWDYYSYYSYGRRPQTEEEVNFVPVLRSNAVLVIAPPAEFELIESLIKELDVPIEKEEVLPKIYRIRNADATEVEKLLNTIFGNQQQDTRASFVPYYLRNVNEGKTLVGRLSGKVRFSSDINTNSIVAIANNKTLYEIVDDVIADIDQAMPELANTLIIPLEHSNATVLAAELNSLFGRPVQAQQRPQGEEENRNAIDFISGWWGNQQRGQQNERPISNLIERVRFMPDPRTNSLLVTTASHNFSVIKDLVEELDKEEPQALVKVRIVEIRKDDTKKLGLRWTPNANLFSQEDLDNAFRVLGGLELIDTTSIAGGKDEFSNVSGSVLGHPYTKTLGPGDGIIAANVNMDLVLQLLLKNLDSEVRTDPILYMSNNTKGSIFAGDNVPRLTRSETTPQGGTNSIFANENVGVTMEITPHINHNGKVVMTVMLNTSRITGELRFGSDILQSRQYNTEIAVKSGETMVLGGIRLDSKQRIVRKIPILGHIPYLGVLFRNYDTVDAVSDIYVFITPTVVYSEQEAREITTEYQKIIGDENGTEDEPKAPDGI